MLHYWIDQDKKNPVSFREMILSQNESGFFIPLIVSATPSIKKLIGIFENHYIANFTHGCYNVFYINPT